ncbi:uncharacterized protein LOC122505315 [Leptopilina heterotoma]|uniref:uncharacterized protein LOC122505315 n=1 Tax=Leptopilina heterotoma TaxID=63436 RepID=UPI001CA8F627|nr:uncharacterized protein LOC122505315 [Leptopilina heterotoma]
MPIKTYSDAVKRLKVLENKDYAFTENEGQDIKAKSIENKYRRNNLTLSQATAKVMKVSGIESDPEYDQLEQSTDEQDNSSSDDASISANRKKNMLQNPKVKSKIKGATTSSAKRNIKSSKHSSVVSGNTISTVKNKSTTHPNPTSSSAVDKIKHTIQS